MIARDKFGNTIYQSTFSKMQQNGAILQSVGYNESYNKPNLFFKRISEGWFYADMRGTGFVPIWEDTNPLVYWKFDNRIPWWQRRRLIKKEMLKLFEKKCSCRFSHLFPMNTEEFGGVVVAYNEDEGWYVWDDGYCWMCGKDFQGEGAFCSEECKEKFEDALKIPCKVCGKKIERFEEGIIRHHVSYFPEDIIIVHAGCHQKIHKTDKYNYLKPLKEDIDRFYGKNRDGNGIQDVLSKLLKANKI